MTVVLGLDCSTGWTSIGLAEERRRLGEITLDLGRRQSARLPVLVNILLAESGKDIRNVDIFAVTTGPGYFTGIRVGLSYITGLAYAMDKSVFGVSTLYAMAYPFLYDGLTVVPVLRARSDSVFAAIYRIANNQVDTILENAFLSPSDLVSMTDRKKLKSTIFVGEDITVFPELADSASKALSWVRKPVSGLSIAMIACSRKQDAADPLTLSARYFRGPDIGKPGRSVAGLSKQ